jgi:dolichyl-phosphate-mannose--protein O-mannosyl transferase
MIKDVRKDFWILIAMGLAVNFIFFGHPNQTVFDEVHFGKFVSGYYTHEHYFDIHPPLGKLLIAGFGKLFDFQPEFSFANIGDEFPDSKYMALRFLPALAGSLIPAVIFLLALQLGFSRRAAFTAGLLMAFENGILAQTRFILMDGFLLLFGFTSLLFYFRKKPLTAGIFAGLAASIKWTGLGFLALILIVEAINILKKNDFRRLLPAGVKLLVIPFLVYFSVFAIHFLILDKPGPGDAYMTPGFQQKNIVGKFVELNMEMYRSNQRLTSEHPYSSRWYSWPFMARTIFYWVDGDARIYFLGNPIIWWGSTAGILMGLILVLWRKADRTLLFLTGAYLINLLPFLQIKRVMFLYHYLTAMIFAVMILVYVIEKIYSGKQARIILTGLALVSFASFLYFAPLTYGLDLSPAEYEKRILLPGWK